MNWSGRIMRGISRTLGLVVLLAALGSPQLADAGPKYFGLGLELGAPTTLNGKIWFNAENAFDFAVGGFGYYGYYGYRPYPGYDRPRYYGYYGGFEAHADYLWHRYGVFGSPGDDAYTKMPLYLGIGGVFSSPDLVGVRTVIGVTYLFDAPFDLFFELAPTVVVLPYGGFGMDAGLGGRFYF